jgi:hypothetical protein
VQYPESILVPELQTSKKPERKYFFNFVNGKQMIKHIWSNVENMTSNETKHNFWSLDESQWDIPNM